MKTIHDLLKDADPLRRESPVVEDQREKARAVITTAMTDTRKIERTPFRAPRLLLISAAVVGILILGSLLWPRMGFETHARVRFEVRLAEDKPAPGLSETKVSGTERMIYLHPEIVLSNEDVAVAEVSKDGNARVAVSLKFTAEGTRKIQTATAGHVGRPVAILIDGAVVMAPLLKSALGDSAMITGMTSAEAERIANGMK
jgi:preprotein translocase subunit SecD